MGRTFESARFWLFAMVLGLFGLGAREARAYFFWSPDPCCEVWLAVCNDGTPFLMPGSGLSEANFGAMQGLAQGLCSNHGGLADITNGGLSNALASLATCDEPSSVTVARRVSPTSYEALTLAQARAMAAQSQGQPVPLPGYEIVSVKIGQIELDPNPIQGLSSMPLRIIYSDEFETGQIVGGLTLAAACMEVPIPRSGLAMLGVVLAAFGAIAMVTRRSSTRTA